MGVCHITDVEDVLWDDLPGNFFSAFFSAPGWTIKGRRESGFPCDRMGCADRRKNVMASNLFTDSTITTSASELEGYLFILYSIQEKVDATHSIVGQVLLTIASPRPPTTSEHAESSSGLRCHTVLSVCDT